ncbi:MAG: hypothetical protein WC588_05455, partial [Candidatus Micrarchaeia archaeon]
MRAGNPFAFIFLFSILFAGCCGFFGEEAPPPALNLTITEALDPGVEVFVMDKHEKNTTSIDANEWFYPVQKGLAEGTEYGFRIKGPTFMPVNEKFVAKRPPEIYRELGVQQYHSYQPGPYTVELIEIQGDRGFVRATANFTVYTQDSLARDAAARIGENCSQFIAAEPYGTRDGAAGSLYDCARDLSVSLRDPNVCYGLNRFFENNLSMFLVGDCRTDYAVMTGNASLCDESSMPKGRGFCKAMVASDPGECMRIECDFSCNFEGFETQQDLCLQWYGIAKGNNTVCL